MPCSFPSAGSNRKAFSLSISLSLWQRSRGGKRIKKKKGSRERERERHGRRNDTLMTGTMNLFFFLRSTIHLRLFHLLVRCPSPCILPPLLPRASTIHHHTEEKVKSQKEEEKPTTLQDAAACGTEWGDIIILSFFFCERKRNRYVDNGENKLCQSRNLTH